MKLGNLDACQTAFIEQFCPYRGSPDPWQCYQAGWYAALCHNDSYRERAMAWEEVYKTLSEVCPGFYRSGNTGQEAATKTIRKLALEGRKPDAWLIPELQTFKNVTKVHFSRAPGCTLSDEELMESIEGTVAWRASTFSDGGSVVDKFGVRHHPKPLYTKDSND